MVHFKVDRNQHLQCSTLVLFFSLNSSWILVLPCFSRRIYTGLCIAYKLYYSLPIFYKIWAFYNGIGLFFLRGKKKKKKILKMVGALGLGLSWLSLGPALISHIHKSIASTVMLGRCHWYNLNLFFFFFFFF